MKIASAIATLALLSSPATRAQSVEGFDASSAQRGGVPAELNSYIESVSARLAIQDRETDVFGRYQDPNQAPNWRCPQPPLKRPLLGCPAPRTPFPDVINAIEVNTVTPAKQQFMVGARKFAVTDVLPIRLPTGQTVKAEVMDVSADAITFRNLATGETVIRKFSTLPKGMIRDKGGMPAPGMKSPSPKAPIEIKAKPQYGPVDRIIRPDHPTNLIADSRILK